jgi:hypothetical protein
MKDSDLTLVEKLIEDNVINKEIVDLYRPRELVHKLIWRRNIEKISSEQQEPVK